MSKLGARGAGYKRNKTKMLQISYPFGTSNSE